MLTTHLSDTGQARHVHQPTPENENQRGPQGLQHPSWSAFLSETPPNRTVRVDAACKPLGLSLDKAGVLSTPDVALYCDTEVCDRLTLFADGNQSRRPSESTDAALSIAHKGIKECPTTFAFEMNRPHTSITQAMQPRDESRIHTSK